MQLCLLGEANYLSAKSPAVSSYLASSSRAVVRRSICGAVLTEDCVVRFRKIQVIINEKEESAIAAFWVSDRVDWCRVGFLLQHLVKHWMKLKNECLLRSQRSTQETKTAQPSVRKNYRNSGVAIAAIISGPLLVAEPGSPKKIKSERHDNKQSRTEY